MEVDFRSSSHSDSGADSHSDGESDTTDSQSLQQQPQEIYPVAVTLRNAFAPQQLISQNQNQSQSQTSSVNGNHECDDDGDASVSACSSDDQPVCTDNSAHSRRRRKSPHNIDGNDARMQSKSQPRLQPQSPYIHIPSMQYPAKPRSEMQGHETYSITHIPIEMELVVPYTLLVQLKNSYSFDEQNQNHVHNHVHKDHNRQKQSKYSKQKHYEEMRNKISAQFGLGKMEHENSGKNDGDVNRFIPVCSRTRSANESMTVDPMGRSAMVGIAIYHHHHHHHCNQASHPLWDHIDERLDDLYETIIALPHQRQSQTSTQGPQRGTRARTQTRTRHTEHDRESDIDTENDENDCNDETYHRDQIWNDIRKHMRIQCKAILDAPDPTACDRMSNGDEAYACTSMAPTTANPNLSPSPQHIILASIPLNPRRLVTLPIQKDDPSDSNVSMNEMSEPNILGLSKYNNSIPHSLPRNTIMVHFSDGSTRVCPALYDVLVRRNVIQSRDGGGGDGDVNHSNGYRSHLVEVDKFERRFEDDIFNMLGEASANGNEMGNGSGQNQNGHWNKARLKLNGMSRQSSTSNGSTQTSGRHNGSKTIDDSKGSFTAAFESLAIRSDSSKGSGTGSGIGPGNGTGIGVPHDRGVETETSMELSEDDENVEFSVSKRSNDTAGSNALTIDMDTDMNMDATHSGVGGFSNPMNALNRISRFNDVNNISQDGTTATVGDNSLDSRDVLTKIDDLDEEMERLQLILGEEEANLKSEQDAQETDAQWLKNFVAAVTELEKERLEINEEATKYEKKIQLVEEMLVARHAIIFKELRKNIFPMQTHDAFTIHGIHLPKDLHSLTAYDEIISAGLGFVCLLVMMCSKYLSIPLRHRLIFNSSRSAVRDCDLGIFPLFKERVVEKDQFDRAILLLNRNIDHLLQSQGLEARERSHMLEKLALLLDHLILF